MVFTPACFFRTCIRFSVRSLEVVWDVLKILRSEVDCSFEIFSLLCLAQTAYEFIRTLKLNIEQLLNDCWVKTTVGLLFEPFLHTINLKIIVRATYATWGLFIWGEQAPARRDGSLFRDLGECLSPLVKSRFVCTRRRAGLFAEVLVWAAENSDEKFSYKRPARFAGMNIFRESSKWTLQPVYRTRWSSRAGSPHINRTLGLNLTHTSNLFHPLKFTAKMGHYRLFALLTITSSDSLKLANVGGYDGYCNENVTLK